jgi:rhomboid protease GluP
VHNSQSPWENQRPEEERETGYAIRGQDGYPQPRRVVTFGQLLHYSTPRYFVGPVIMGLNVAVFLLMVMYGVSYNAPTPDDLLFWGANHGPLTLGGQWWRLLTSTFVHVGFIHLLLNMQGLWRLSMLTERLYGNWTFLVLYILSGLGGSAASLWSTPDIPSAGASGAIFGVAGGLVAFLYLGKMPFPRTAIRGLLTSTLLFVGYNLLYGFTSTGIDNAAHLGGLVTGAVVGALLTRPIPPPEGHSRLGRYVIAVGLVALMVAGTLILR